MMGPSDHLAWAKKPCSQTAVRAVYEARVGDRRLRAIWKRLVDEGIATESGNALLIWQNHRWVSPNE